MTNKHRRAMVKPPPFPPVLIGKGGPGKEYVITQSMGGKPGTPYECKVYAEVPTPERAVRIVVEAPPELKLRIWTRKGFRWREISLAKLRLM